MGAGAGAEIFLEFGLMVVGGRGSGVRIEDEGGGEGDAGRR